MTLLQDNDAAARYIHARRLEGAAFPVLIHDFRKKFPEYSDYGRDRVRDHYNRWAHENQLYPVRKKQSANVKHYVFHDAENPHKDPRRASILHLLDLKRAGHSPRRTERRIVASPLISLPAPPPPVEKKKPKPKIKLVPAQIEVINQTPDELMNAVMVLHYRTPMSVIIRSVCVESKIDQKTLLSQDRRQEICLARYMAFWICRRAGYSLPSIGKRFEDRDHTTVLHGVRQFEKHLAEDGQLAAAARRLHVELITARPAPYWGA